MLQSNSPEVHTHMYAVRQCNTLPDDIMLLYQVKCFLCTLSSVVLVAAGLKEQSHWNESNSCYTNYTIGENFYLFFFTFCKASNVLVVAAVQSVWRLWGTELGVFVFSRQTTFLSITTMISAAQDSLHDLQWAACQRSVMSRAEAPPEISEYFSLFRTTTTVGDEGGRDYPESEVQHKLEPLLLTHNAQSPL